jgi:hypothetical protein
LGKWIHVLDLENEQTVNTYAEELRKPAPCGGCFWDPAFESISKANRGDMTIEEGRKSFRHELSEEAISNLIPEAQKWFQKK